MRTIKFRGKTINCDWVFGNLANLKTDRHQNLKSGYYISNSLGAPFASMIIPETIGQFTGLYDKNGEEIYEGDIVKIYGYGLNGIFRIYFDEYRACFNIYPVHDSECFEDSESIMEIIGNIHDNPELLTTK